MKNSPETEKPLRKWALAGGMVVFAALFLLWALGFDLVAGWIQGCRIEAVLNWLSTAWMWIGVVSVVIAMAVGSWGSWGR